MLYLFVGILLICIASLRYGDRDYEEYIQIYEKLSPLFKASKYENVHGEPGYLLLNRFCKLIGIGHLGVFFLMAFSSVALSLNFFRKNTKYFFIALLIYFCHVFLLRDMLQIRAGLAASIGLYTLSYISERKFLKFSLILFLAATFHSGVAILLLVYLLYPLVIKEDKRILYLSFIGYVLGFILTASLLERFFVDILYIEAISYYTLDSEYFRSLGLLNPVLLKNTLLLCVIFFYRNDLRQKVRYFDVFIVSLSFSVFWLAAFNEFAILAARLATFLSNTEQLLIPSLFYTKINKFFLWIVIVAYCIYLFISKFETFENLSFYFLL